MAQKAQLHRDLTLALWRRFLRSARTYDSAPWAAFETRYRKPSPSLEHSAQFQPDLGSFYLYRADAQPTAIARAGKAADLQRALGAFEKSRTLNPSSATLLRNIALCHKYLAGTIEAPAVYASHAEEAIR